MGKGGSAWEAACWAAAPCPTSSQVWAPAPAGEGPGPPGGSQVLVTPASPEEEAGHHSPRMASEDISGTGERATTSRGQELWTAEPLPCVEPLQKLAPASAGFLIPTLRRIVWVRQPFPRAGHFWEVNGETAHCLRDSLSASESEPRGCGKADVGGSLAPADRSGPRSGCSSSAESRTEQGLKPKALPQAVGAAGRSRDGQESHRCFHRLCPGRL